MKLKSFKKSIELSKDEIILITEMKRLRHARNLSQSALAKKTGVSTGLIAQLETFRKKPTKKIIEVIFGILMIAEEGKNISESIERIIEFRKSDFDINSSNAILISDNIIKRKDELEALIYNHRGIPTIWTDNEELLEFFKSIENIPEKYAIVMPDNSMKFLTEPSIEKGDTVIIKYLDGYKADSLQNDDIVVLADKKRTFMRKIKKVKYYTDIKSDTESSIICCIAGDTKIEPFLFDPLNESPDNLKIKGIVILTVREPAPKFQVISKEIVFGTSKEDS
jgi:transcriptional regulator with XRE-family HTH domain